ncbi:hypothetical protein DERP_005723 [Dermatophagoides pteronyssinus]|uniref:GCS light chain n=1 Tax=Dermatophagoides pteronyssinus TaxID=6956 RepID=A0ABQ8J9D1_DERPT|nr:hypothetical protein DERP_005723 [Dermatophagoides pteronyssinus]
MSSEPKTIIIDTGNIFKFGIIQRKGLNDVNVEVLEGIASVLDSYSNRMAKWDTIELNGKDVKCLRLNGEGNNSFENHDRSKLKLTVKLFLYADAEQSDEYKQQLASESINALVKLLNLNQIDNLILSVQTDDMDQVLTELESFWTFYETFVLNEKIRRLGTSDLNFTQLSDLYGWAKRIKPSSTQINLNTCCDIPADLSAFAKENSIQLLTHNDPVDNFIPIESLQKLFKTKDVSCSLLTDNQTLKRKWIARYTFVLPGQGVVLTKGYMLSLLV